HRAMNRPWPRRRSCRPAPGTAAPPGLAPALLAAGSAQGLGQFVARSLQLGAHHLQFVAAEANRRLLVEGRLGVAQAIACTADGKALLVKQVAYAANEQNLVVLVITAVAAPLDRLELGEFLFPVAKHMRLDATQVADLTDGEIALGRNRRQGNGGFS